MQNMKYVGHVILKGLGMMILETVGQGNPLSMELQGLCHAKYELGRSRSPFIGQTILRICSLQKIDFEKVGQGHPIGC
jgi:hypothetical protein